MNAHADGWYSLDLATAAAGDQYHFVIDGDLRVPDPASRFQQKDAHGPSTIIDPDAFSWTDADWTGRKWEESVIYELHIGTFTPEGTFAAAMEKLPHLKELGITAIEIMPVADFPGAFNWGYDGVLLFAPDSRYGSPDDLKRLIQAAHAHELMVFLDVVYNHFGPDGNYLYCYAKPFFTDKHKTPWGDAINLDQPQNEIVRSFFENNALYWLNEYNLDGLRFDAVHALRDDSERKFLEELAKTVRENVEADKKVHLILENDDNDAALLERSNGESHLYTAQWNDDIHHCLHVIATAETSGYYADFADAPGFPRTVDYLAKSLAEGFAYQGQPAPVRNEGTRGKPSAHLPSVAFVSFLQNHDQIGNTAFGERLSALTSRDGLRAVTAVLLLAPQVPMLFMGEEWKSKSPFNFFCDLSAELAPSITEGRRNEFAKFPEFSDPKVRDAIPDPCSEQTFKNSKLNWDELAQAEHQEWYQYVRHLIFVRQQTIIPRLTQSRGNSGSYNVLGETAFMVTWALSDASRLTVLANLGDDKFTSSAQLHQPSRIIFQSKDWLDNYTLPPWQVIWSLDRAH